MGVNTFLADDGSPTVLPREVIRSTTAEKEHQIAQIEALHDCWQEEAGKMLGLVAETAVSPTTSPFNGNIFAALIEASKVCSLGQITNAMYAVGGQYRRNM
jgi:methylmalonyl-CoA mutase